MLATKKKKQNRTAHWKLWFVILLVPVTLSIYIVAYFLWVGIQELPVFAKGAIDEELYAAIQEDFDMQIPLEYIPVYMAAEEKYGVPWTLLAAHHRIETRFSTMNTLVSPVGAEGHMQFMPCTFVGWSHPTCSNLGEGDISQEELTNVETIKKYGGYGVDANGDGIADPYDIEDAVFSAANYLARSGVAKGELKKAIFAYNHDEQYVEDVLFFYKKYEGVRDKLEIVMSENEKKIEQ